MSSAQASPSPSPVGYSPMTPGAPSPGGYNPHTPGSNIEQGGSDWVTTDILVRVKDSFMDLMGQTGVIRSVTVSLNTWRAAALMASSLPASLILLRNVFWEIWLRSSIKCCEMCEKCYSGSRRRSSCTQRSEVLLGTCRCCCLEPHHSCEMSPNSPRA